MNRREIELQTRETMVKIADLLLLVDSKIDILLGKLDDEKQSSKSSKKKS